MAGLPSSPLGRVLGSAGVSLASAMRESEAPGPLGHVPGEGG